MHWIALQRRLSSIPLYRKIWDPNKLNNLPKDIAKWRQSQDMDLVLRFLRTVLSKNFSPPEAPSLLIETGMQYNRGKKRKTLQFTHFKKFIKLYICFMHASVFLFYIIIWNDKICFNIKCIHVWTEVVEKLEAKERSSQLMTVIKILWGGKF